MRFQPGEDVEQLVLDAGEVLAEVVEVEGVADAGHHVLALGVDEEVAVGPVLTGGGIASEADPGARLVVAVAEHHRLDVDGGAEVVRDLLAVAVRASARAVPGVEHCLDGAVELALRILRERPARLLLHDALERGAQLLEGIGLEVGVAADAGVVLGRLQLVVEARGIEVEHDPRVHGDEPAVRVVREALVVGGFREALHAPVVEAEVEDGVHHPRHRELGPRTHAHQQRVGRVAQASLHLPLEVADVAGDLVVEPLRPPRPHVVAAGVGGDGEARRHRQA